MTMVRRIDRPVDAEQAFLALYRDSPSAFWLDSSRPGPGVRFSFMGDASGPLGATVTYDVDAGEVRIERGGEAELRRESILTYLERELERLRPLASDLPFDFDCGFAGYLGYEMKADCGASQGHRAELPDATFVFADRMLAFDHEHDHVYLLCLSAEGAEEWLDRTAAVLTLSQEAMARPSRPTASAEFRLARPAGQYLDDIATCQEYLLEGESYEICLTNSIETEAEADPLSIYMDLRRINPAPFASYLRFGGLAVMSSSPERFLRIDRAAAIETRPIKGTCGRGASAAEDVRLAEELRVSEKNRAENLMIVDLMRNDLGAVCEIGSVEVPALMEVETYETVHQLVSTVSGQLASGLGAIDAVRSCFPPGSMTGAPKLRTMEILDELEGAARGVYSGAIGFFGLGGGCDLSVTIRTIVLDGGAATIGTGGAIVLQSDPESELREALLKARAPMLAIDPESSDRGGLAAGTEV